RRTWSTQRSLRVVSRSTALWHGASRRLWHGDRARGDVAVWLETCARDDSIPTDLAENLSM
ncbi:uncharacterized protein METZ01_LOCUS456432, partial [marine metagenome]